MHELVLQLRTCGIQPTKLFTMAMKVLHNSGNLKLLSFARRYVCLCMCVCVSAPEGINNQWRDMV